MSAGIAPPILVFCSGRDGVGTSTTVANLAAVAQREGLSCLVWDANTVSPQLHILFGVSPIMVAADSYAGSARIEDIPLSPRPGIWLVPERPGGREMAAALQSAFPELLQRLCIRLRPELVLVDTAPGWSEQLATLVRMATYCAVVMADDIGSILDAYALLKALVAHTTTHSSAAQLGFVITHTVDPADADTLARKLNTVTQRFLGRSFPLLGSIPYDPGHREVLLQQRLLVEHFPNTFTAMAYQRLLRRLVSQLSESRHAAAASA